MFLDYLPHTLGVFLILLISLLITDIVFGTTYYVTGNIIEKHYIPSSSEVGVGKSVNPSGQMGVVTTTSSSSEKFIIIIRTPEGEIINATSTSDLYFTLEKGDNVEAGIVIGRLTKIRHATKITKKID